MTPATQHALNSVATAAIMAALSYFGFSQPAKQAQNECCPIARECVMGLINDVEIAP